MIPISMAEPGKVLKIVKISGRDSVRQHLAELGFVPDAEIKVVTDNGGNMIIQVGSGRIAIDKAMANRIMV